MADEAERQAKECKDEKRKKELLTIAENCRVVPENPPQTFMQALQAIWFTHVYFHIEVCTTANGYGRFDQYMWPYYKKDVIDEKNINEELHVFTNKIRYLIHFHSRLIYFFLNTFHFSSKSLTLCFKFLY